MECPAESCCVVVHLQLLPQRISLPLKHRRLFAHHLDLAQVLCRWIEDAESQVGCFEVGAGAVGRGLERTW